MSARTKPSGVLGALAGLVGFSAIAGVLVTALVTPALAVTGMTANSTIGIFEDLPDYITIEGQNQRNTLWATQGGQPVVLAQIFEDDREEVAWDAVAQFAKDAAVAAEDERFYEHNGVDLAGIVRAAVTNAASGQQQGASTIDQQVVKNLLINRALEETVEGTPERAAALEEAAGVSLDRKLREAKLAIGLENRYTKEEILLAYLNIAAFGGTTYGIEAAAQKYYSTTAANLTLAQAASLIAIVQAPGARRPDFPENWSDNQSRRDAILAIMLKNGMVDQAQYDEAIATPVNETTIKVSEPKNGCLYATGAKFFCDYVRLNIRNLESLGATPEERDANWRKGGYNIYTTIDLDQNAAAEQVLATNTPATETRFQLGSSVSTVQVGTGRILVMAQNKVFDNTETAATDSTKTSINFNTDVQYGGSTGFQVGSTYKLFTLVNWLQNGHGLQETVNGSPATYNLDGECVNNNPYLFKNDGNSNPGRINVLRATSASVNAAFANMASKLDLCAIRDTAKTLGVHRADGQELFTNSTMILGTDEIAPLSIANAYATVAANGVLCQPIAVDKVVAADGTELPGQNANCTQAISPDVAAGAAKALQGVMSGGTGGAASPRDGIPLIGKTGTADATSTMIAVASTKVASATWVGNIVGKQDLRRTSVGRINGGQLRFGIMRTVQASLDQSVYGTGAGKFPEPSATLSRGSTIPLPNLEGQSLEQARRAIQALGLTYVEAASVPSVVEAGRVATTSPGGGALVSKGTTVEVHPSDGSLATTMPEVTGTNQQEAVAAITGSGFDPANVTVEYVEGDPAERCRVTATNPEGGESASKADDVTVTVNRGDAPDGAGC